MSPEATHLVYVANNRLYLRALDQIEPVPIRGTEGGREPFFSLDGEWIGFYADGYLKKVAITGGTPVTLCEADNPFGASWTADGTIVFGQWASGIWEVSANGGEPRVLVEGGKGVTYLGPQKLPDGKTLLITVTEEIERWDESTIVVDRLDTGERKTLIRGGSDARYVPCLPVIWFTPSDRLCLPCPLMWESSRSPEVPSPSSRVSCDPPAALGSLSSAFPKTARSPWSQDSRSWIGVFFG